MKNKKGFTLIELLVVIAIIGLLSTLAVVSLNNARSKARDARRLSDIRTMQSAIELYKADNNDGMFAVAAGAGAWATLGTDAAKLAPYLPGGMPIDPSGATGANKYILCTNAGTNKNYLINATLENNAPAGGSVGAISVWVATDCINSADPAVTGLPTTPCDALKNFCLGDISK